jgi:hypothetical protein
MGQFIDLTGDTFYDWEVVDRAVTDSRKTRWNCICKCGNEGIVESYDLRTGHHKSCGKCHYHMFIQDSWWGEIKKQADRRGYEFSITKDYLTELWELQEGKCALSGLELYMPKKAREQRGPKCTASIDRIDNSKGYILSLIHI